MQSPSLTDGCSVLCGSRVVVLLGGVLVLSHAERASTHMSNRADSVHNVFFIVIPSNKKIRDRYLSPKSEALLRFKLYHSFRIFTRGRAKNKRFLSVKPNSFASSDSDGRHIPQRKAVIEKGVLKTLLHNLESAKAAGVESTGNASRAGYFSPENKNSIKTRANTVRPYEKIHTVGRKGLYKSGVLLYHIYIFLLN